jgi:hypothetical protein
MDFARKPRGLDELARWRATELHFVLLHAGIAIFKGIIRNDHYKHFYLLDSAVRILSSPILYKREEMYSYCESLLKLFV